jgi:hypothetical protein
MKSRKKSLRSLENLNSINQDSEDKSLKNESRLNISPKYDKIHRNLTNKTSQNNYLKK